MMNYLVTLRYDGGAYHGFQIQNNAVTVQSVFQDALLASLGERPDIKGCSRTDSGVHANKYCLSLKTDRDIDKYRLLCALNAHLPDDVRVVDVRDVPEDFHARYSCISKRYKYLVCNSPVFDPFARGRAAWFVPPIDCVAVDAVAQSFVGTHDFSAFCGAKSVKDDHTRTVYDFSVVRDRDTVVFSVSADGFLYNMVRIMVGTLFSVARGKLGAPEISEMLKTGIRSNLCITAPACGLYLDDVVYDFGESDGN